MIDKDHWYGQLKCDVTKEDVVDERGRYVASFLPGIGHRAAEEREGLRKEVIKRCNLFDELVAACEQLLEMIPKDKSPKAKAIVDRLLKEAATNKYKAPAKQFDPAA